uniref:Uncharacterized protein n=1 Tax=Lepeophtheirus salmonis TaxID=72036 RepID=A0A0K2VJX1_LEPSM
MLGCNQVTQSPTSKKYKPADSLGESVPYVRKIFRSALQG